MWHFLLASLRVSAICILLLGSAVFLRPTMGAPSRAAEPVSTSFTDALPVAHWLNNTELSHIREENYYSDSGAGYYRFDTQSYCLHAGAYSPTKGDGYLLAPLLGSRSEIIAYVLQRSALHPAINQRDIQVFIWAIEAQTSYLDLPPDLRTRLAPLLTSKEMATLSEGSAKKKITGLLRNRLPKAASDAMNTYEHLRSVITDASSTYKEIEAAAIKAGIAPASDNRADVPAGQWSYVGGNRYMRVFPSSYQHTVVELLRTATYSLTRDETKHMMVFESEGLALKVSYTGDGSAGHPSTIQTIQLPGDTRPVPLSPKHIVISPSVKIGEGSATTGRAGANREIGLTQLVTALRADRAAQHRGNVEAEGLQSIADLSAFRTGVMSAFASTNASQQRVKRIVDLLDLAVIQAACTAAGDCQPNQPDPKKEGAVSAAPVRVAKNDSGSISAGSPRLVLTSLGSRGGQAGGVVAPVSPPGCDVPGGIVAVPANTGNQRLGVSPRCPNPPKQCTQKCANCSLAGSKMGQCDGNGNCLAGPTPSGTIEISPTQSCSGKPTFAITKPVTYTATNLSNTSIPGCPAKKPDLLWTISDGVPTTSTSTSVSWKAPDDPASVSVILAGRDDNGQLVQLDTKSVNIVVPSTETSSSDHSLGCKPGQYGRIDEWNAVVKYDSCSIDFSGLFVLEDDQSPQTRVTLNTCNLPIDNPDTGGSLQKIDSSNKYCCDELKLCSDEDTVIRQGGCIIKLQTQWQIGPDQTNYVVHTNTYTIPAGNTRSTPQGGFSKLKTKRDP